MHKFRLQVHKNLSFVHEFCNKESTCVTTIYRCQQQSIFLFPDASGLKEAENVRDSQEKVVQALQHYTSAQYPDMPSKFAELLLRMPELHRVCQVNIFFFLDELLENSVLH